MTERKSVQGGYCGDSTDEGGCALTKLQCNNPSNFQSSRQMRDSPLMAHGGRCRWQDSIEETQLGMCFDGVTNAPIECATTVEGCHGWDLTAGFVHDNIAAFVPKVTECTVNNTPFGRCSDGMCAWDPAQCLDDHSWTPFDRSCTCDEVQTGACSREIETDGELVREVFCAVTQDGCDDEQTWIAPRDVKGVAGFDCFLCREDSPPTENSASLTDLQAKPVVVPGTDLGGVGGVSDKTTVIAVSSIGAVVGVGILGLIGYKVLGARRAAQAAALNAVKVVEHPPIVDIDIPSETDPEFGGPNTDTDNASVLSAGSRE